MKYFMTVLSIALALLVGCGGSDSSNPNTNNEPTDTIAPVITLNGEPIITLEEGDEYVEGGATATDNVDGNVDVTISGNVDINIIGTYQITYSASDSAGNTATATREVNVVTAPEPINIGFDPTLVETPALTLELTSLERTFIAGQLVLLEVTTPYITSDIDSIVWSFDNGEEFNGSSVEFSFEAGVYGLTITATDINGETAVYEDIIQIVSDEVVTVPKLGSLPFGDVNRDGVINDADVNIVREHVEGSSTILDAGVIASADINLDESVDEIDVKLLEQASENGWATYISHSSALPATSILIMHPSLLSLLVSISIEFDGQEVDVKRNVSGYATFVVPLTEESLQTGKFKEGNLEVNLNVAGETVHSFDLILNYPQLIDSTETTAIQKLTEFKSTSVEVVQELNQVIDDYGLSTSNADELKAMLSFALEESQTGLDELNAIFSALTPETLALIESLSIQSNNMDSKQSINNYSPKYGFNKIKSASANESSCPIPTRAKELILASEVRDISKNFLKSTSEEFSGWCSAIAASSIAAPVLIPLGAACVTASSKIGLVSTTAEVITNIMPEITDKLSLSSSLELYEIKDTGDISVDLNLAGEDVCEGLKPLIRGNYDAFLTGLGKGLAPKFVRDYAFSRIKTINKISKKIKTKDVLTTTRSIIDSLTGFAKDGVYTLLGLASQNMAEKVCNLLEFENTTDLPTCALDEFKLLTNESELKVGLLDKELGTYTGPSVLDCLSPNSKESGNMKLSAALHVEPLPATGLLELPFKCNYISDGKANLLVNYNNTVTSVDNDEVISGKVTDDDGNETSVGMYCEARQVSDTEDFTENWDIELSDGTTNITWTGDPEWSAQGVWSSENGSFVYSSPDPIECSQDCNREDGVTFYGESTWDVELFVNDETSTNNVIRINGTIVETQTTSWSLDDRSVTCRSVWNVDAVAG